MACFWNSIIQSLNSTDLHNLNVKQFRTPLSLVLFLKVKNCKTIDVLWNKEPLTDKQLAENIQAVKIYNHTNIYSGYFCSTFEPMLFLISHLFKVNIEHDYNGVHIEYVNYTGDYKWIYYKSNNGHIDFIK
tara:strand:+ start:239 stop:631 length:393 start_codon:yes stop_codon:yes gene_type:complete